jgi:hypothetical protein
MCWIPFVALPLTVLMAWALAALSFRRATNANADPWIAAASVVPIVQIPAILFLCLVPAQIRSEDVRVAADSAGHVSWSIAVQGMLAGTTFSVASVALGALVFGTYGYGMFVLSPLMIGGLTGYLANRPHDIGTGSTAILALGATGLGGIALVVVALEGILCLALAFPLTLGLALLGGALGRKIANAKRATALSFMSVTLLPLAFVVEREFPPVAQFRSHQAIDVAAPPARVWDAIVHMQPIDSPPPFLFGLGVAYPMDSELEGAGVGALRRGVFSTGVATERVTQWIENVRFALEVLSNPPAMRELSPYDNVHAPHVRGYFDTRTMDFEIVPRGEVTVLIERTSHDLKLDPLWYWLPLARWMVQQNNGRVLAHIKQQAEQSAGIGTR